MPAKLMECTVPHASSYLQVQMAIHFYLPKWEFKDKPARVFAIVFLFIVRLTSTISRVLARFNLLNGLPTKNRHAVLSKLILKECYTKQSTLL